MLNKWTHLYCSWLWCDHSNDLLWHSTWPLVSWVQVRWYSHFLYTNVCSKNKFKGWRLYCQCRKEISVHECTGYDKKKNDVFVSKRGLWRFGRIGCRKIWGCIWQKSGMQHMSSDLKQTDKKFFFAHHTHSYLNIWFTGGKW